MTDTEKMDSVQEALDGHQIIPIHILQDLGRQSLRKRIVGKSENLPLADLEQLWVKLRTTACDAGMTDKHLRACCNAVCVFLTCTARSERQEVREIAFSKSTWSQNLDIVHKSFSAGRGKAALQVLETSIQLLLNNPDQNAACEMLRHTVYCMMRAIITGSPESRLKESCVIMSHFLHKTRMLVPFSDYFSGLDAQAHIEYGQRCEKYGIEQQQLGPKNGGMITRLFLALLFMADVTESHTAALKLFSYLCALEEESNCSKHITYANEAITIYLSTNPNALPDFGKHVLPAVINSNEQFLTLLMPQGSVSVRDLHSLNTFLAVLEVGRQKSFVNETKVALLLDQALLPSSKSISSLVEGVGQNMTGFRTLLSCKEPGSRLQAFSLLTTSPLTNAKVSSQVLDCLTKNFTYIHDDSDAYYRDEFTSILRRFLERLGRSAAAIQREERDDHELQEEASTVACYRQFMNTYLNFLKSELSPNASYPRHILALQTLSHILVADLVAILNVQADSAMCALINPLLSLVLDPFEDVRCESAFLLQSINKRVENASFTTIQKYDVLTQAQRRSAITHRSDHADALGRLHMLCAMASPGYDEAVTGTNTSRDSKCRYLAELVRSLRAHIDSIDHLGPANSFPLHGTLLGIAYCTDILDSGSSTTLTQLKTPILELCRVVWHLVQEELCVDTPERTTEIADLDELVGPKDLLAYSWRALRDSSLIIQSLLNCLHECSTIELYESIGDLCLEQLIRLRHRGAFSTVAQTFVLCCQKTRSSSDVASSSLLYQRWYKAAFREIEAQAAKLTRRSAGLPAMFAALLDPSEPKAFKRSIDELVHIAAAKPELSVEGSAENDTKLPQVHALNCLKDIMLNSMFRSVSQPIVVTMLNLAARCLASNIWAIRNCGLMLFRACIGRLTPEMSISSLDGNEEANGIGKETPLAMAIKLLGSTTDHEQKALDQQNVDESKSSEIIFAALDLLGRIPLQAANQTLANDMYITQLGNRLWSVRDYAARLIASSVSSGEELATARALLFNGCLSPTPNLNELHGKLLCSRYILQKVWTAKAIGTDNLALKAAKILQHFATEMFVAVSNPYVMATYLDILNDAYGMAVEDSAVRQQIQICSELISSFSNREAESPQLYLLHRSICLNDTYRYLCAASETHHTNTLQQEPRCDIEDMLATSRFNSSDTALYVLEELKASGVMYSTTLLQEFYLEFAVSDSCENVRTVAMENLAQHWKASGYQLSGISLKRLQESLDLYQPCSRELFNAQIMLASHVVNAAPYAQVENLTGKLISALQESLCDELEAPTRLNAVLSLQLLIPRLLQSDAQSLVFTKADTFRILCILYDFLNDDDEEIREAAVIGIHEILIQRGWCHKFLAPCTTAARENLLALLKAEFGHTAEFKIRLHAVVLGAHASTTILQPESIASYCGDKSVDLMLRTALARADELFAEEKQNLYIDDIAEISAWSASVTTTSPVIETNMLLALHNWTLTGLQRLIALIDVGTEYGSNIGPLGPSYNLNVLITFMRCIVMASLLMRTEPCDSNNVQQSAAVRSIREHVMMLKNLALEHCVHFKIIEALETATS